MEQWWRPGLSVVSVMFCFLVTELITQECGFWKSAPSCTADKLNYQLNWLRSASEISEVHLWMHLWRNFPRQITRALIQSMRTSTDRLRLPLDCQEVVEVSVVGPGRKKWIAAEWSASKGKFCPDLFLLVFLLPGCHAVCLASLSHACSSSIVSCHKLKAIEPSHCILRPLKL